MNKKEKIKQLKNSKGISIKHNPSLIAKDSTAGITLIALVVTIIVLIILAAVSINLVLGDNGIITKARDAARETEEAKLNEEVATNELMEQWEGIVGGGSAPTNPEEPVVIEGPVAGGNYDNPYIPTGFTHTEGDGTWNSGYTIKEIATGNEFVWVPCVTDATKIKDGDNVEIFKKTLPTTTDTTDPYYMYNKNNSAITGDENSASAIRTSVGTYGGFYIAKYEAGVPIDEEGNEIAAMSATTSQKARSVSGATVWVHILRVDAIIVAENMIDPSSGVKSELISGECWDTTLQWMVNTSDNATENAGYDIDSTGNGWYRDVSSNVKAKTGQYSINNIYDMGGNAMELTSENGMGMYFETVIRRGGECYDLGSTCPAANRYAYPDSNDSPPTFRVVLYK